MAVEINNLNKNYGDNIIFENFNMQFEDNCINCILGESGCGKTTLLNIISGLDTGIQGKIKGVENNSFSYIFQEPRLLSWYTVYENMMFALKSITDIDVKKRVVEYLKIVNLYNYKDYYPKQLSGGMKQRVSIARAFAYPSEILLMDEPFKGLDLALKKTLMEEFLRLWMEDKRTVLFVTHDVDEAVLLSDNIHILGGEPIKELFYTKIKNDKLKREINDKEILEVKELIYSIFIKGKEEIKWH